MQKQFNAVARLSALFLFVATAAAPAAPVVFTLDPGQSQLTLSGKVAGTAISEQAPGSLTTRFEGSIKADLTGNVLTFTGGSRIDARTNGDWEPAAGGAAGSAPADFGGKAVSLFATIKGAFRDIVLDVTSFPLTLNNGAFDSSALAFAFPSDGTASFDYDLILDQDRLQLSGLATNKVGTTATLATEGDIQRLTIQIDTEYKFKALTEGDSTVRFVGKLVAVATPPVSVREISFTPDRKKFQVTVTGASASTQLQSSRDLKSWTPRAAERVTVGSEVQFTAEPAGAIEFFRVAR